MHHRRPVMRQNRRPIRRRRRGCAPRAWLFIVLLFALGIGIYTLASGIDRDEAALINDKYLYEPRETYNEIDEYKKIEDEPEFPLQVVAISTHDIVNTGYLSLVNHQHPAPGDPDPNLLTPAWPTVAVSRVEGMYLHNSALRAIAEMIESARSLEVTGFFVTSAFRDFDAQAYLFSDGENSGYIMPPGHSEHQTGLAADILVIGQGMMDLPYTPEGQWLAGNSYRYGLILRYPQGAEHITGINFEPWHFRYVGQAHAYYMMKRGFVLEEYIIHLQDQGHISFEKGGETIYVIFQRSQSGMIYVPYGRNFTVSSDNMGGYIIWTTG